MLRQIIIPNQNTITINLPDEMVGKQVEVIAFEIEKTEEVGSTVQYEDKLKQISAIFDGVRVNRDGYKFDRDEANNYDR